MQDSKGSAAASEPDLRQDGRNRPMIEGVTVREDDIETVKGIKAVVNLFRGMTVLLLVLMVVQLVSGMSGTVAVSVGVLVAESVRLVIFAGLLWVIGDLAALWVKSHYDIRATRILLARVAHSVCDIVQTGDKQPPQAPGSRADGDL